MIILHCQDRCLLHVHMHKSDFACGFSEIQVFIFFCAYFNFFIFIFTLVRIFSYATVFTRMVSIFCVYFHPIVCFFNNWKCSTVLYQQTDDLFNMSRTKVNKNHEN